MNNGPVTANGDYVGLTSRFTSGWPWPDDSWGLDPMYGADGWCHTCGTPNREQTGRLVLKASGLPKGPFWMPNWRFNALCVRLPEASNVIDRFALATMPVHTPRSTDTNIVQLLPANTPTPWYDPTRLTELAAARHGRPGNRCPTCQTWRWYPLPQHELPSASPDALSGGWPFIASPEWFGDGCQAFHQLLIRRNLAHALVALDPKTWSVEESPQRP